MKKLFAMAVIVLSLICFFTSCDMLPLPLPQEKEDVITVEDGYLVVNGVKTEYKIDDGTEPEIKEDVITIDKDGYIVVNGTKTEYNVNFSDNVPNENTCTHAERMENEVKSTCEKSGSYDLVTYCTNCGKEFSRIFVITEMLPHTESDWIVDKVASCTEAGSRHRECTVCGTVLAQENIDATGNHSYGTDGKCTVCGAADPNYIPENPGYSVGLEYTSNGDGTCYVSGIGTCTDTDIIIPSISPDGEKVVRIQSMHHSYTVSSILISEGIIEIDSYAFGLSHITKIYIPKTMKKIGHRVFGEHGSGYNSRDVYYSGTFEDWCNIDNDIDSFLFGYYGDFYLEGKLLTKLTIPEHISPDKWHLSGCKSLEEVTISDKVAYISDYAFYNCINLKKINIPSSVTSIGSYAFYSCDLTGKFILENLSFLGDHAFFSCDNITEIIISSTDLEYIEKYVFWNCTSLRSIVIPHSVTYINDAFYNCSQLQMVFYHGTLSEWNDIQIDTQWNANNNLLNSTRYYYSETQPTTEGNFWHYVDGVPTVWEKYVAPENLGYSVGLEYTSNGDGTCYVSGIGTCTDTDIVIPEISPEGWTVTGIGERAFYNCTNMHTILIPKSVKEVCKHAFAYCSSLAILYFEFDEESLKQINVSDITEIIDIPDYPSRLTISYISASEIVCYSETQPTNDGNFCHYWHYVDGVPTVWN